LRLISLSTHVEHLPDLLRRLPLDHVGHGLAPQIQQRLDVHVVGGQDQLKELVILDFDEIRVPFLNVVRTAARVLVVILGGRKRVVLVVLAVLDDLGALGAEIL
jgi:hypothetical protein